MFRQFLRGVCVFVVLCALSAPAQAQDEAVNWLTPVLHGSLQVLSLRGGDNFEVAVPVLQGVFVNQDATLSQVYLGLGDILQPATAGYCTFILAGQNEPIPTPTGQPINVAIFGYCQELPDQAIAPTPDAAYAISPAQSSDITTPVAWLGGAAQPVLNVITRARAATLEKEIVTQLAIWQVQHNLTDAELATRAEVADLSLFRGQLDYLLGRTDVLPDALAATPATPADVTPTAPAGSDNSTPGAASTPTGTAPNPTTTTMLGVSREKLNLILYILVGLMIIVLVAIVVAYLRPGGAAQPAARPRTSGQTARGAAQTPAAPMAPPVRDAQQQAPTCVICLETGHTARDCPHRIKKSASLVIPEQPGATRANVAPPPSSPASHPTLPQVVSYVASAPPSDLPRSSVRAESVSRETAPAGLDEQPRSGTRPNFKGRRRIEYAIRADDSAQTLGVLGDEGGLFSRSSLRTQVVLEGNAYVGVSGPHALIRWRDNGVVAIKDLRSKNGTFVYGEMLAPGKEMSLADGAHFRLGEKAEFILDIPKRKLITLTPGDPKKEYPLEDQWVLLTRHYFHEVLVPQPSSISAPHLLITPDGDNLSSIRLKDLGSLNGAQIDGKELTQLAEATFVGGRSVRFTVDRRTFTVEMRRQDIPETIDRQYKVLGEAIYDGNMATVYKVENETGEVQAAKVLSLYQEKLEQARRGFSEEIRLMRTLSETDGHILLCLAAGVDDQQGGAPYFIMPYLEGNDVWRIMNLMNRHTQRPEGLRLVDIKAILDELLSSVETLHQFEGGFIHCDIKPHNIFITTEGHVYLLDLGVATRVGNKAEFGTDYYSAPEVITRDSPVTVETDIYSLGTVLFEMITGQGAQVISNATGLQATAGRFVNAQVKEARLTQWLEKTGYGLDFASIISQALQGFAQDRQRSLAEFREQLNLAFQGDRAQAQMQQERTANLAALASQYKRR